MDYENRIYNYSEKLPIKERNYSYYLINNKGKTDYNFNSNSKYSNKTFNNNDNNLVSTNMRMSNIESRLNTMEKMMKYFDEFIHLKEEEKLNNLTSLEISSNMPSYINQLISKINKIEKELENIKKDKQIIEEENKKIIENLNNKIQYLEKIINNNNLNLNMNMNNDKNNNNNLFNNESKKMKLSFLSEDKNKEIYNKKYPEIDELIQNKLNEIYSNNKISEMLYLIEDINKIAEDNEFNINEQNENIRKIQNDNLTLIKVVAVHSEKINNIDYILSELANLKKKYFQIVSIVNNTNNEKEEEMFVDEFIAKYKDEKNQDENNNINNNNNNNNNN